MWLKDKVIIIPGSTMVIGKAIALKFHQLFIIMKVKYILSEDLLLVIVE